MHLVILGGNNEQAKAELRKRFAGQEQIEIKDFTREVPLYMDACDVLFTKPGGLTSTEAAVKNIPLIHTAPIPGCETENADFFSKLGISIAKTDVREAAQAAAKLCTKEEERAAMQERQRREINPHAAQCIFERVMQEAAEAEA